MIRREVHVARHLTLYFAHVAQPGVVKFEAERRRAGKGIGLTDAEDDDRNHSGKNQPDNNRLIDF